MHCPNIFVKSVSLCGLLFSIESVRSYICVLGVSILFLSVIFLLDFRTVPTVLYFVCVFHVSFCLFCFVFFVCLFLFISFFYVNNRCKTCKWSVNSELIRDGTSFITITTQSTSNRSDKTDTLENSSRITLCHLIH